LSLSPSNAIHYFHEKSFLKVLIGFDLIGFTQGRIVRTFNKSPQKSGNYSKKNCQKLFPKVSSKRAILF